jgi:hypothetical protein
MNACAASAEAECDLSPKAEPTVGFTASLLAVWCQILLLATISPMPLDISAGPVGDVPICHADDGTGPAQQKPDHPARDCALCVICLSQASAPSLLSWSGPTGQ